MRLYIDTSIWLDVFFRRGNHGNIAFHLFQKALRMNTEVVVSDLVIKELRRLGLPTDKIIGIFHSLKPVIRHIHMSRGQVQEAKRLAKALRIPGGDALHAILARDCAAVMVTRDRHFSRLAIVPVQKPEELI